MKCLLQSSVSWMAQTLMPKLNSEHDGDEGLRRGGGQRIQIAVVVTSKDRSTVRVGRSLIEKPKGLNSTLTLLSLVREPTEMRFLTKDGDTRTLFRWRGERAVAMVVEAR